MNISFRNIPKLLSGGDFDLEGWIRKNPEYYIWYSSVYPNAQKLLGDPLSERTDKWNLNQLNSSHHTSDDLKRSAYNNYLYTNDYNARQLDLQNWISKLKNISSLTDEQIRDLYNTLAGEIRKARESKLTYGNPGYSTTNDNFKNMFNSRSVIGTDNPLYVIGFLNDVKDIEGTSTWLRRMDRYLKPFELENEEGKKNRTFTVKRPNGREITFYKKENGDIELLNSKLLDVYYEGPSNPARLENVYYDDGAQRYGLIKPLLIKRDVDDKLKLPDRIDFNTHLLGEHKEKTKFDWSKIGLGLQGLFSNPNLYAGIRLFGNLQNNERVYDEYIKGIRPFLRLSYNTYRQVVGDEATKLGYYRRAAQGQTKAGRPFTSDADRQVAYQMEAKRIGDELRAQGDLADNQRIRETSELSSQHLDANRLRATEVANANMASLIEAAAKKHGLLALKYSAQWSSIDNYLQGIEYRKRQAQAEDRELADRAWLLNRNHQIETDPKLVSLQKLLEEASRNPENQKQSFGLLVVDWDKPQIKELVLKINNRQYELNSETLQLLRLRRRLNNLIWFSKSGSKITNKKKDDLLYKSAKDVVDHFRKMIALDKKSNKSNNKIEKLAPHPKGNTRKYLLGGVAPFTIYKPVALGGERTISSETSTSSTRGSKSSGSGDTDTKFDVIKELFENLLTEGLPSDTNSIYASMMNLMEKKKLFGNELSSDDLSTLFINQMYKTNMIKFNKALWDKVSEIVHSKNADSELAITPDGRVAVLNLETKEILYISPSKVDHEKYVPLTNLLLLNYRAFSPNMAFDSGMALLTAANATSMLDIAKFLKEQLPKIEASESVIEGYTKRDTADIKSGVRLLLEDAPEGVYKYSIDNKTNTALALKALNYLYDILPNNMKTLLSIKGGKELIPNLIESSIINVSKTNLDAATGSAAKNADGSSKEDGLKINSATQLLLGMSSPREFVFSIGNGNMFNGMARVSSITKDGNPMGADFAYSDIYKSDLHKNLDLDNASFGDIPINKSLKDRIIIDNSTIAGIDLPYITDRKGRIIPDFEMLNKIEEADLEILKLGINPETEPQRVNEIYAKHNLPIKYGADNRLTGNYKRFAVIQATAIEDVFLDKSGLASNGTLSLVSDEEEINKYINEIKKTTGEKEIDMDRPGLFTGDKDIFKGSIFIPIIGDLVDAVSATGELKAGNYDELRNKYLTKNYNKAPLFVKQ